MNSIVKKLLDMIGYEPRYSGPSVEEIAEGMKPLPRAEVTAENKVLNNVIFECIAGSKSYGTDTEDSDTDYRGIFVHPERMSLLPMPQQQTGEGDSVYYEIEKFFKLAADCNPNIIELLWTNPQTITDAGWEIIDNRNIFISQKALHTFSGYAYSQVKRAKGQNKWINNPQPEAAPDKHDFCWVISVHTEALEYAIDHSASSASDGFPLRPVPVKEIVDYTDLNVQLDISKCVVAKLEHSENMYRIYDIPGSKGVFRGDSQQLVVESISKEQEFTDLQGLMIFNEQAYESAKRDHSNYWVWRKERNEARYRNQEEGKTDYDCKNMMHCIRLLWSGESILTTGNPIVRFEGERLEVLRDIREGKYQYKEVLEMSEDMMEKLRQTKPVIPKKVNIKTIDKLYQHVIATHQE